MVKTVVGGFEIEVGEPYPAWVKVSYRDQVIRNIHHSELRDLEYAIGRAIKAARAKLPEPFRSEMD